MHRLTGDAQESEFLDEVMSLSGQDLLSCLQCGKCTGGCPIAPQGVLGPRGLIAMILCNMRSQVLEEPTWWYCVACGTCQTRCPVDINMYEVATALCQMAAREGIEPSEPKIEMFEQMFLASVAKHGRVQELRTVMAFNLATRQPFKDLSQGMTLMRKGVFSPLEVFKNGPSCPAVSRIFAKIETHRAGDKNAG
jgi:heterodisulfide reductase subunit C